MIFDEDMRTEEEVSNSNGVNSNMIFYLSFALSDSFKLQRSKF